MKKKNKTYSVKTLQFGEQKIIAYVVKSKPTKKELKEIERKLKNE